MKAEELFCKIGVRFINKNGLSPKTYNYLITKDWINSKKNNPSDIAKLTLFNSVFKIITEDGYNYKGSGIVIVDVDRGYSLEWECLKVIKDLIYLYTECSLGFNSTNSNTFKRVDFYGEENNLVSNQFFNICSNNTTNTIKAEGICNCTSETIINSTLADSCSNKINVCYNPFESILANSKDILCNNINLTSKINDIQEKIERLKNKESEENKMFNFNHIKEKFQFGLYKNARMSPYGIAFTSDGKEWTAFDENHSLIDVTGMVFDFECVYAMPVAADAIKSNDVILHNKKPVIVTIHDNEMITCVDITTHEVVNVLPTRSPFGFNFYTKLVSFMEGFDMKPTNDNPFGNIWPFLLMEKNGNNKDMMMAMMLMNQQNNQFNPMMMYLMMEDNKNDSLPYLFMMGQNMMQNYNSGKHECKCGRDIATEKKMSRYAKEEER